MKFFLMSFMFLTFLLGCADRSDNKTEKNNKNEKVAVVPDENVAGEEGLKLDCMESAWLEDSALQARQGTGRIELNGSEKMTTANPIQMGVLHNIHLFNQDESATKNLNVDVSTIEENGYKGSYGAYVSFTPDETAVYRVAGSKAWQSPTLDGTAVQATAFINECSQDDSIDEIYQIVEWKLQAGKQYVLQLFNSDNPVASIFIYKPSAQ